MKLAKIKFNDEVYKRYYIDNEQEAHVCCKRLQFSKAKRLGLDIETAKLSKFKDHIPVKKGNRTIGPAAGLCPMMSAIRLIQIYEPISKAVYVFDVGKMPEWKSIRALFEVLNEKCFIAHNGVFEIKHFTHNGFPDMHVDCSMLLSILVDRAETSPFEPDEDDDDEPADGLGKYKKTGYSLEAVTARLYKFRLAKAFQTSNWNARNLSSEQINYAALDAILTYKIGKDMIKKVTEYKMEKAYEVLRDMQHVVADMELKGIELNRDAHRSLIKDWEAEHKRTGDLCTKYFKKVNVRSSKQMNEWAKKRYPEIFWQELWPKTKSSKKEKILLSFGKNALKQVISIIKTKYKKDSPALEALLEFKKVDKLLSTYGETLEKIVHPVTGRLHSSFIIGETRTGRLSGREPNLQNLPRDKKVRALFVPAKGKWFLVADYSQIEIRSAAALSNDPVMTNAFIKGIDLHKYIVKMCFGYKMKDITEEQRQLGKAINFGYQFGMGAKKFKLYALTDYGEHISDRDAEKTFDTYHSLYKVYSNWCQTERNKCERLGFVRTPLGKIRKLLPEEQYTRSVNTQVQGGAAEVIMLALIDFRQRKPSNCHIVNTIHDEIIVECPTEDPKIKLLLEDCMIAGFKKVFPDAPTNNLVEAKFGYDWVNAKRKN